MPSLIWFSLFTCNTFLKTNFYISTQKLLFAHNSSFAKEAVSKLLPLQVEEPVKPLDEKQKAALTAAYKMPQSPCIMVHPNPKAKSGKFDCSVVTLSSLLDYRPDDNKEATFEGLSTTLPHFCCAAPFLSLKRNTGCSLRLPEIMDNS